MCHLRGIPIDTNGYCMVKGSVFTSVYSLYVGYISSVVEKIHKVWQVYLFRAKNIKCMYTSASDHTVDCIEYISMPTQLHTP